MRALGLIVTGMLALSAPIAGHAAPSGSSMKQLAPAGGIVQVWGGCGWGWHPVPRSLEPVEEMDGFLHIARLTTIIADGVRTALGKVPTEGGAPTAIGEAPTEPDTKQLRA